MSAGSRSLGAADLRRLVGPGGRGAHVCVGASADPARAQWLEVLSLGEALAASAGSGRVLALLEGLLAADDGRWHVVRRDDVNSSCAAVATRILRTAGAVTNNPDIAADPALSQATDVTIFLSETMPVAPMRPAAFSSKNAALQYVGSRNRSAADRFVSDFSQSWACYSAFGLILHDASDPDARQRYLTAWLAVWDAVIPSLVF